jgi:tetratricopeptide (TPR) repeat protein
VDGNDNFQSSLKAWCTGFIANAQKAANELRLADASFARVWRLWKKGEDGGGLLSEARLLDLEASLRWAQRRFTEALRLHDHALAVARPEEFGHFLLNKSATLEQKGDYEASLAVLLEAESHVDGEQQPRLRFGLRFNEAACLIRLSRAEEAAPIMAEVRKLADRLGNHLDLVRTRWIEGTCAAGLGRREEAHAALEGVRQAFAQRNLPFDYALASLDVALLYREEGRFAEIKVLAAEMVEIFKAQQVDREALAAVILFKEAAEKEQVTAEMVKRLADYLRKAQRENLAG